MGRQVLFVILVIIPIALIAVPIALAWRKELKRRRPGEPAPSGEVASSGER